MTKNRIPSFALIALGIFAFGSHAAQAQDGIDPAKKEQFISAGCWACHGTEGQGGEGPALVPNLHPFEVLETFVRQGTGTGMIPYPRSVVTDEQLHDIYSYLQSLPPPPENVELLQQ